MKMICVLFVVLKEMFVGEKKDMDKPVIMKTLSIPIVSDNMEAQSCKVTDISRCGLQPRDLRPK